MCPSVEGCEGCGTRTFEANYGDDSLFSDRSHYHRRGRHLCAGRTVLHLEDSSPVVSLFSSRSSALAWTNHLGAPAYPRLAYHGEERLEVLFVISATETRFWPSLQTSQDR